MAKKRNKRKRRKTANSVDVGSYKRSNLPELRLPNIGVIIFAFIFLYIIVLIFMAFTKEKVSRYEVRNGSLSLSNTYQGLILRDETTVSSNSGGYINYFAREGERVAAGDLIYSLDQTGKMAEILKDDSLEVLLSGNDLYELRNDFLSYAHNYTDKNFQTTYDFSYDIKGSISKLANYNMLNNLKSYEQTGAVEFFYAPKSGTVVYNTDGFENVTVDNITYKDYAKIEDFEKKVLTNNTLIGSNETVYKMINSEYWYIVVSVDNDRVPQLEEEKYVQIKFLKNQFKSWAKINILESNGEQTLIALQLNNSMITFAKDRLIDIEIILKNDNGLKIPNSAIVEKEFYLIPKDYAVTDEKGNVQYFMRETFDEEGNVKTERLEVPVYSESETDYYVDTTNLRIGDYIIKDGSTDKYPISKIGTLVGVYNINKGFADFKEITILYQNEEYAIIKSNTNYGLLEYDYIVLNADTINEDDFINN